jgi:LAS superfamily LD-carboxypeptidase LdcB
MHPYIVSINSVVGICATIAIMNPSNPSRVVQTIIITLCAGVILGAIGYGGYRYYLLDQSSKLAALEFQTKIADLEDQIKIKESEKQITQSKLNTAQLELIGLGAQVGAITDTIGALDKLSRTDPELLKKYSKVFFLSENYEPAKVSDIDSKYAFEEGKALQVHSSVKPYLEAMLEAINGAGIETKVVSAYRSFGTQGQLKNSYKVTYGAGTANSFSAEQGYSEHQLGTTVDFTTPEVGGSLVNFQKSTAYSWLLDNAHRYGFVLSYPDNNAFYTYEPWHWRFVGVALATKLHREKIYFYDLDQREIDTYLINIFD